MSDRDTGGGAADDPDRPGDPEARDQSEREAREDADPADDPFAELEDLLSGADPDVDDLFDEMAVADVDEDVIWEELAGDGVDGGGDSTAPSTTASDGAAESSTASADGAATDGTTAVDADLPPGEAIVEKGRFCQRCEHFAEPPDVGCGNPGTEIVEMVDVDRFRLRDCPVVERRRGANRDVLRDDGG